MTNRHFDVNTFLKSVPGTPHFRKQERHEISSNFFRKTFYDVFFRSGSVWYHWTEHLWKFVVRIRSEPILPRPSSGVASYFKVEIAMTVKLERP